MEETPAEASRAIEKMQTQAQNRLQIPSARNNDFIFPSLIFPHKAMVRDIIPMEKDRNVLIARNAISLKSKKKIL